MFLWFYSLGKLPVATAMTLNYMSSIWMALFLIGGGAMLLGQSVVAVLWGADWWPPMAHRLAQALQQGV